MLDGAVEMLERRRAAPVADRGMIVGVVSWILLVAMVFTLLIRLAMKFAVVKGGRRFGLDDVFIVLAAMFSVGQTAAVSMEAMHALGQHMGDLTLRQQHIFQKAEYAGHILYIANMGCARISVCLLIMKILPGNGARCTALAFAFFSALCAISGVLVTIFPCPFPDPWRFLSKRCIDVIRFVNYIGITNVVVEVILVILPLVVWNLRLSCGRSISVSCVFLARLSVIAALFTHLVLFNRNAHSPDPTYSHWTSTLSLQIAQNLSIITACLPCLHPFILGILSGTTKPESLRFDCKLRRQLKRYFNKRKPRFDPTSSNSSSEPFKEASEKEAYCRPLATYGLDRSSEHRNAPQFNRFPTNVATPISGPNPPENVFMRSVQIPPSRSHSVISRQSIATTVQHPHGIPKSLTEVGVLPVPDWDTESSDRDSERSRGRVREKKSDEYVFSREKVISVAEVDDLWDDKEKGKGWKG